MGKASRRKRERRLSSDKPRWAGAPGFDRAFKIAELYASVDAEIKSIQAIGTAPVGLLDYAKYRSEELRAFHTVATLKIDILDRQVATLQALQKARPPEATEATTPAPKDSDTVVVPGNPPTKAGGEYEAYARSLAVLANEQLDHMRRATPIVFDPLGVPDASPEALIGFGLPFPVVVADFLAPTGLSLPVESFKDNDGWWVGLTAATISQGEENGPVDVWPTVTTLEAGRADHNQSPRELMFGHIRFGGPLPDPPEGLVKVEGDNCEAWVVDIEEPKAWAALWLYKPALAAISAMRLLDAVNVDLQDVALPRSARRRAEREGAKPALTVNIRTHSGAAWNGVGAHIEWSHRWTVRGHWKHFGEHTAVARRHPSRIVEVPGRGRCVKVWTPPYIKGPADKPLVLKSRLVAAPDPKT